MICWGAFPIGENRIMGTEQNRKKYNVKVKRKEADMKPWTSLAGTKDTITIKRGKCGRSQSQPKRRQGGNELQHRKLRNGGRAV